jgi:hypothetical protein
VRGKRLQPGTFAVVESPGEGKRMVGIRMKQEIPDGAFVVQVYSAFGSARGSKKKVREDGTHYNLPWFSSFVTVEQTKGTDHKAANQKWKGGWTRSTWECRPVRDGAGREMAELSWYIANEQTGGESKLRLTMRGFWKDRRLTLGAAGAGPLVVDSVVIRKLEK